MPPWRAFCRDPDVALVALEATDGYERPVFGALSASRAMPDAFVNPTQPFLRSVDSRVGVLAKTDRMRLAGCFAWYAQTKGIGPTPPASATQASG